MAALVKFVIFTAALIAFVVMVVIPAVAGPMVSSAIRDAGFDGDDVEVGVDLLGASILSGKAPSVHLKAEDVAVSRARIGRVDVTLHGVSLGDRSFESISGTLERIQVNGPSGRPLMVDTVELEGPAAETRARGRVGSEEARALVMQVARDAGVQLDDVTLADGHIVLTHDGTTTDARLRVAGEALILERSGAEAAVLIAAVPSEPWKLRDVGISPDGLLVDLTLDARALATQISGG